MAWEVHRQSLAKMLRLVSVLLRQRYPGRVVPWPPETASQLIAQVGYGFELLELRNTDLGVLIPELAVP